jgi:hypothetical protein
MRSTNQAKMFALIEAKQPDQNVGEFCKANGISEASYYYWLKKYRQQNAEVSQGFVPIQVSGSNSTTILASIQLPGGALIHIYSPEVLPHIHCLLQAHVILTR